MSDTMDLRDKIAMIARFMGIHVQEATNKFGYKYYYYNNSELQDEVGLPDYDESWDDLMPVVEKLELLYDGKYIFQHDYDNREEFKGWYCILFTLNPKDEILKYTDDRRFRTKFEAIFDMTVEFISWHNQQK